MQHTFRLPIWPERSGPRRYGLLGDPTADRISFRSATSHDAIYVGIRFQAMDSGRTSIRGTLMDIFSAQLSEAKRLVALLTQVQKAIDRATEDEFIDSSTLTTVLTAAFKSLRVTEVVEYRTRDADVVRPINPDDVSALVFHIRQLTPLVY